MILLWQCGFQNTKVQRELVAVNQAKSSFCWESLNGEWKGGPGALSRILDTCFQSSLTGNQQWHSTCPGANSSHKWLESPFWSSHQASGTHKKLTVPQLEEGLWLPNGKGEPRRWCCPAPGQRQGTECPGSWEEEGAKSQGWGAERGQPSPLTDILGWPPHGATTTHAAKGGFPATLQEK